MAKEKPKFPSMKSISELIEDIFCSTLRGEDERAKRECKRLMKARRRKKMGREELLAKLGLDYETFRKTLDKAIEETEKRL